MKVKFIKLRSSLSTVDKEIDKNTNEVIDYVCQKNMIGVKDNGISIFLIESGGSEEEFIKIYKDYSPPYFILTTCLNNSLPASLEIISFLSKHNLKSVLLFKDSNFIERLTCFDKNKINHDCLELKNKTILKNKKYGVVGKPSDWLISSFVNYNDCKKNLGATLLDIKYEEFIKEIDKNEYEDNKQILHLKEIVKDQKTLHLALCIYGALKRIIIKYNLDGLTVRCFDLLHLYKNTSCIALALLNDEGYICSCEGDIPTLMSMAIIYEVTNKRSFQVNPSNINNNDNTMILAHCTIPLCLNKNYSIMTHYESNLGLAIKGEMYKENILIFKIASDFKTFCLYKGKIEENLSNFLYCRTQILVKLDDDISKIYNNPLGNHLVVFYNKNKDEFLKKLLLK